MQDRRSQLRPGSDTALSSVLSVCLHHRDEDYCLNHSKIGLHVQLPNYVLQSLTDITMRHG